MLFRSLLVKTIAASNDHRTTIRDQFEAHNQNGDLSAVLAILADPIETRAELRTVHFARQALLDDATLSFEDIVVSGNYNRKPDNQNAFHRNGGGQNDTNVKYQSADGHHEFIVQDIFGGGWQIVTAPENVGTYNFFGSGLRHLKIDVRPWLLFGNAPDDTTTTEQRDALYRSSIKDYFVLPDIGVTGPTVFGSSYGTWVSGTEKDETIYAGAGDDYLYGGAGADRLFGGSGFDIADYYHSSSGVAVDLARGLGYAGDAVRGAVSDTFHSIEGLSGSVYDDILLGDHRANRIGGSTGDDSLYGREGQDSLNGNLGDDTLRGGEGNDTLTGAAGDDFLFGGTGTDTAYYVGNWSEYSITRLGDVFIVAGDAIFDGTDQLSGVEQLEFTDRTIALAADEYNTAPTVFRIGGRIYYGDDGLIRLDEGIGYADADGDPAVLFEFWDSAGADSLVIDGVVVDAREGFRFARLDEAYVREPAGSEQFWIRAYDGQEWSPWITSYLVPD